MSTFVDRGHILVGRDGAPVQVGDTLTDFRGDASVIASACAGRDLAAPNMFGARIYVRNGVGMYPSVFGCAWVPVASVMP